MAAAVQPHQVHGHCLSHDVSLWPLLCLARGTFCDFPGVPHYLSWGTQEGTQPWAQVLVRRTGQTGLSLLLAQLLEGSQIPHGRVCLQFVVQAHDVAPHCPNNDLWVNVHEIQL